MSTHNLIFRQDRIAVPLENLYHKQPCFLIGAGPSLDSVDLTTLNQKGIVVATMNNMAAQLPFSPQLWFIADDPYSFHPSIWRDSTIAKFSHQDYYWGKTRCGSSPVKMPNSYFYIPNRQFQCSTFLTENTVSFGRESHDRDEFGQKGGRQTILCAIRLLYYLGFRQIYLLGMDFKMSRERPYVFNQKKHAGGVQSNNDCYRILSRRFEGLLPYFKKAGLMIFNCGTDSALTVFPRYDLQKAIGRCRAWMDDKPELHDLYKEKDRWIR